MTKVKIGMISFAHSHANSYLQELLVMPEVEIVGIADEDRARVEAVTGNHGIAYYEDYHALLAADLDAVIICSENVHHARITMDAANAGKHVLCEKPLGITVSEMRLMIDTCERNQVQLMTAFPCRYLPAVIEAKQAIDRGEIGSIIAVKGTNRGTMPGRWFIDPVLSGGGAILDHTVHVMDLMRWIVRSEPATVYAESGKLFHDIPVEDAGMVHIQFDSGVVGVIDTSWSRSKSFPFWGDVTMEIIGTEGVISVDAFAQKNEIYEDDKLKAQWSYWGDRMDSYLVHAFVQSIAEGHRVPITGEDGLQATAVALAAYESVKRKDTIAISELLEA
ncbi:MULTISPECIES: Gfo/Idh/MocA family protein [unclassified Paenibacillus]|uniref:Gfo/Idh/MocA family protein n=1 Tax=unclassified Paenibacillus TaxID=185978 RepID=UPI003625133E